jgi:hypothetical protein
MSDAFDDWRAGQQAAANQMAQAQADWDARRAAWPASTGSGWDRAITHIMADGSSGVTFGPLLGMLGKAVEVDIDPKTLMGRNGASVARMTLAMPPTTPPGAANAVPPPRLMGCEVCASAGASAVWSSAAKMALELCPSCAEACR